MMATVSTLALATLTMLKDWLRLTVPVPIGVLIVFAALILLPTGDLIRVAAEHLNHARPGQKGRAERNRHRREERARERIRLRRQESDGDEDEEDKPRR
jgi:hypothetical protein